MRGGPRMSRARWRNIPDPDDESVYILNQLSSGSSSGSQGKWAASDGAPFPWPEQVKFPMIGEKGYREPSPLRGH